MIKKVKVSRERKHQCVCRWCGGGFSAAIATAEFCGAACRMRCGAYERATTNARPVTYRSKSAHFAALEVPRE
jgi:hypothetical protein